MIKSDCIEDENLSDVSSNDGFTRSSSFENDANIILWLECKEGGTLWTLLSMFSVFFTSFTFSSYCFFVLVFLFEDSKYFHMEPALALRSAAFLIFWGYPFNLVSSMLTGQLYVKFGRRKLILAGFFLSITGGLLAPFAPNVYVMYLYILLVHIGSAWTQNPPLIADYIQPASIGKAVAIQGFMTSMASLFSIGVIFSSTKHLDMRYASLIIAPILYFMSAISISGLKEVRKSDPVMDPE